MGPLTHQSLVARRCADRRRVDAHTNLNTKLFGGASKQIGLRTCPHPQSDELTHITKEGRNSLSDTLNLVERLPVIVLVENGGVTTMAGPSRAEPLRQDTP